MTTIAALLGEAVEKLASHSESPHLDAEILLAHVMGKSRTHLRTWPEKPLMADEEADYRRLVEARRRGTPIAYLMGWREFWSREFLVTPAVLIPRPETELLIELALQRLPPLGPARIADLGTGSGAIAVTLAAERPQAQVTALDFSPAALAIAERNAALHFAHHVRFIHSDWFAALPEHERFDLIVSNPPYIAENDPHLAQGDVRFEPPMALSSGPDGLNAIRRIVLDAPGRLARGGCLLLEHGYDQAEAVQALLTQAGFAEVASYEDLQGHQRVSGGRLG